MTITILQMVFIPIISGITGFLLYSTWHYATMKKRQKMIGNYYDYHGLRVQIQTFVNSREAIVTSGMTFMHVVKLKHLKLHKADVHHIQELRKHRDIREGNEL